MGETKRQRQRRGSAPRLAWRDVTGILLLDKPAGVSSNTALQHVRRLFGAAKAGHTGALDPLATGLLPICFGEATKIAGLLLGSRKAYLTEALLGVTTDSADADGEVVERRAVPPLDEATIEAALATLRGRIRQVPPIYSALKRDGEPLYRIARRGETVDIPERDAEVFRFEQLAHEGDRLRLLVECGSGTYVRSLVRDLGERLGCGAHVTVLRRLWIDPFEAPAMHTIEALEALAATGGHAALDAQLLSIGEGLRGHPVVDLDADASLRLRQGQVIALGHAARAGLCLVRGPDGSALALAECGDDGMLRTLRGFNTSAAAGSPVAV